MNMRNQLATVFSKVKIAPPMTTAIKMTIFTHCNGNVRNGYYYTTLVVVNNSSPVSHSVFWHNNPYCPVAYIDLRYIFFQHQCFHVDNNWRYMICKSLVNALSLHSSKYCLTIWFWNSSHSSAQCQDFFFQASFSTPIQFQDYAI